MWITWKHQHTDLSWPLTFDQKVDLASTIVGQYHFTRAAIGRLLAL